MKRRKRRLFFERLIEKIAFGNDYECWEWCGAKNQYGYGVLSAENWKVNVLAHRASYEYHFQTNIPFGLDLCHSCNNPGCCNPWHLYPGTRAENMKQAKDEGRLKREYKPWSQVRRDRFEEKKKKFDPSFNKGV